jgi:hypothetical protein
MRASNIQVILDIDFDVSKNRSAFISGLSSQRICIFLGCLSAKVYTSRHGVTPQRTCEKLRFRISGC